MKTVLTVLALILVLAFSAGANDLAGRITATTAIADTIAAAVVVDSAYTNMEEIQGYGIFQFASSFRPLISGGTPGGNLTDDTVLVWLEHSWDKVNWTAVILDTLYPSANDTTSVSTIIVDLSTTIYGPYLRGKFVHRDVIEADIPDSLAVVYVWDCHLWIGKRE